MGSLPSKPVSNHVSSPPPHGLISLPNELLLEIAYYLTGARDVSALLRTNRRLAILLPHVLSAMLLHAYNSPTRPHLFYGTNPRHFESLISRLVSLSIDLDAVVCDCDIASLGYCRCETLLHNAITQRSPHMVAALLRHGASITVGCGANGDNAVHCAIQTMYVCPTHPHNGWNVDKLILRMLLGGGRLKTMNEPAALNKNGQTWLNMAVRKDSYSMVTHVKPFLVRGLDVNVADDQGLTPLHLAVFYNRPDLAKMLLQRGANHRTAFMGIIPPFVTACNRSNCEVIHLLLSRDAGLIRTVVGDRGETAEIYFQRSIDTLMLRSSDRGTESWLRELDERTRMLRKLTKLASASRRVEGGRFLLQVYYFAL